MYNKKRSKNEYNYEVSIMSRLLSSPLLRRLQGAQTDKPAAFFENNTEKYICRTGVCAGS
jgi:hypothetical protein